MSYMTFVDLSEEENDRLNGAVMRMVEESEKNIKKYFDYINNLGRNK